MAIIATISVCVGVSTTGAEVKDGGHLEKGDKLTTYEEGTGCIVDIIPAGVVDKPLPLAAVSSCAVFALVSAPRDPNQTGSTLTLKRNLVGNEAVPVTPVGPRKQGYYVISTESLTALFVSNPGTTDMKIHYAVLGS